MKKSYGWVMAAAMLGIFSARPVQGAQDVFRQSLVKIYATIKGPDWSQPWQMVPQSKAFGSGFIIAGKRIMTNAHLVANQMNLEVRKEGDTERYQARVEFVGHDCDLALLTVDDPGFFSGTKPMAFGPLPETRDHVTVYGFPEGGDQLSITEGVVSRCEMGVYTHGQRELLTLQVDAAINPGNSGGPVVKGDKVVGVAFQSKTDSQSQGFLVPAPMIARFLQDIADGHYDGVPGLGVGYIRLESPQLRKWAGLPKGLSGVLVQEVTQGSSVDGVLAAGDILVELGGKKVANDGTVQLRDDERVRCFYPSSLGQIGEKFPLKVVRKGELLTLNAVLKKYITLIAPAYDVRPRYMIYGGLVFVPYTWNLTSKDDPARWLDIFYNGLPSSQRREMVLLLQVLPDQVNKGYESQAGSVVERVNGKAVVDFASFVEGLKHPVSGWQKIELDDYIGLPGHASDMVVMEAAVAEAANPEILAKSGIQADRYLGE